MDYDETEISRTYDQARGYPAEVLDLWIERILAVVPKEGVDAILDLGCGTGRYSFALARAYDACVIGVDPSGTMLVEALQKAGSEPVAFCRGTGEQLPLPDGSVDMAFLSMVFHHLNEPGRAARECCRVLRPGGRVCLRSGSFEEIDSYPEMAFFPNLRDLAERDLIPRAEVTSTFEAAGLRATTHQVVTYAAAASWSLYVEKLSKRADSFLTRLSDEDFEAGIAALSDHAARADPNEAVPVRVDLFAFERG